MSASSGTDAFGGELAERHLQPGAGRAVVDDAAEFEVEQLADPQPGAAQHGQPARANGSSRSATAAISRASTSGVRARGSGWASSGNVGGEHQPPGGPFGPAPGGDVVEQVAHARARWLHDRGRDLLVAGHAGPASDGCGSSQELLDVAAVQLPQDAHLGMLRGEVLGERRSGR